MPLTDSFSDFLCVPQAAVCCYGSLCVPEATVCCDDFLCVPQTDVCCDDFLCVPYAAVCCDDSLCVPQAAGCFYGSLCVPEDDEGSHDPIQCHPQGSGPLGLLLEGGRWLEGVPVESRERGVECGESESEILDSF